jgi:hypothetical protein
MMDVAAFVVACVAAMISAASIGWQIYTWRRAHRFDVHLQVECRGVGFGGGRYPLHVVVTNHGGTTEWIDSVLIQASYDRDINKKMTFYAPELVRNPARDRELAPRQRFESEFNLLSGLIGGGGLPKEVRATVHFASGRQEFSAPYQPNPEWAENALEPRTSGVDLPEGAFADYFPSGPFQLCPDCRSEIPSDARVCAACGFRFESCPPGV